MPKNLRDVNNVRPRTILADKAVPMLPNGILEALEQGKARRYQSACVLEGDVVVRIRGLIRAETFGERNIADDM